MNDALAKLEEKMDSALQKQEEFDKKLTELDKFAHTNIKGLWESVQ